MVNKRIFNAFAYFSLGLLGLYITSYQSLINLIVEDLNLKGFGMGIIVALHFIGSAAIPPLFGIASDKKDEKLTLIISIALSFTGLSVMWLSRSNVIVGIGILIVGCGYAAQEGLLSSLLTNINLYDSKRILNRSQMYFCIGAIIGPFFSSICQHITGNWRYNFMILSFLYLCLVILALFIPIKIVKIPENLASYEYKWNKSLLILLCIILSMYVGIEQGIGFFIGQFFLLNHVNSLSAIALTYYWFGMFFGRLVGGIVICNHTFFTILGLSISVPFYFVIIIFGANLFTAMMFCFFGILISLTWSTVVSITVEQFKSHSGEAVGYLMTAGACGGAFFPFIIGLITDIYGINTIFIILQILSVITIILLTKIYKVNISAKTF